MTMAALARLARKDNVSLAIILAFAMIALTIANPAFFSSFNLYVVLTSVALWTCVALAQMTTLATGQMSLSVGSLGGLVAIVVGGLCEIWGVPLPLAIVAGLSVGLAGGLLNGALIAYSGINSFIITLATFSAFHGLTLGLTRAVPLYHMPEGLKALGNARIGPVPVMLGIVLVVALLVHLMFVCTRIGRHMLAYGGNATAAMLSGLSVKRVVIFAHSLSGLLSAVAAILTVGRLQIAQPTIGEDWLIVSFAAPIIGGASLTGGHVSVTGTLLALALLAVINDALVLLGVDPFWVQVVLGCLILAVVGANRLREGRRLGEAVAR
jgi:ribose transport system permease protein